MRQSLCRARSHLVFTARLVPPRGTIARSQSRSEDETISLPSSFTPRAHGSTCAAAWHYSEIARSQSRSGDEPISLPSSSIPPSQHDRPKGKTARSAGRHTADTSSEFAEHACEPPPARRQVLRPACRSVGARRAFRWLAPSVDDRCLQVSKA